MHLIATHLLIIAFFGAIIAGSIDSVAGGGGLISVPLLLAIGLHPATALGTNRMQSIFGESMASARFMLSKKLDLKRLWFGLLITLFASAVGTVLIQMIHPTLLNKIIPFVLLALLFYVIFSRNLAHQGTEPKMSEAMFYIVFGSSIGFYNGFFGPSTGSFWTIAFMVFLGFNIQLSVMHAKPMNLIGNISSFIVFAIGGHMNYLVGFVMGAGQIIGANIGAHMVIHRGTKFVRPFFIIMVTAMTLYLFLKT